MLETTIGGSRLARAGYELDDVSLVPGRRTRDVDLVDVSIALDAYPLQLPVLGAPLDAVISPATAGLLGDLGGLGVLSLEGLWTRYDDPTEVLAEIATLEPGPAATVRLQQLYQAPVRENLIGQRVEELRQHGFAAASLTPQKVERYHHAALEAGLDLLVIHGVTVTAQHVGRADTTPLDLKSFTARYDLPVIVGGVAHATTALHLMRTGAVGVLVGIGASSVSTTADTLGIHVPTATAIAEVAAARTRYLEQSG
ncbi:MAG: IMP dehydrogenase, partial [Nitriliruptoraceae bacterium]